MDTIWKIWYKLTSAWSSMPLYGNIRRRGALKKRKSTLYFKFRPTIIRYKNWRSLQISSFEKYDDFNLTPTNTVWPFLKIMTVFRAKKICAEEYLTDWKNKLNLNKVKINGRSQVRTGDVCMNPGWVSPSAEIFGDLTVVFFTN